MNRNREGLDYIVQTDLGAAALLYMRTWPWSIAEEVVAQADVWQADVFKLRKREKSIGGPRMFFMGVCIVSVHGVRIVWSGYESAV